MSWRANPYHLVGLGDSQIEIMVEEVIDEQIGPFEGMPAGWKAQEKAGNDDMGSWSIASNGAIYGQATPAGAILWCEKAIEGDHMIEFQASTVPPDSNDINCMWEGSGKYSGSDPEDYCTIGGVGGWWHGFAGIERALGNLTAPTGRFINHSGHLVVGQIAECAAGRLGEADFLFVNGNLAMQVNQPRGELDVPPSVTDGKPDPSFAPQRSSSRVCVSTYDSQIFVYCMRVSKIRAGGAQIRHRKPIT